MLQVSCHRLEDRVAIVTGAGQWIGRGIALRLAQEGADVVVNDIVIERANEVVDEIKSLGRKALAVKVDVTKSQEVNQMVKATLDEFGKIDILVNNVGGCDREGRSLFCDSTEVIWDDVIARNLKSAMNCSRAVINHMLERKSGKIINISSGAGIRGGMRMADYSAAKAGVIGFTMALAREVSFSGVRVNCISPGPIGEADNPLQFVERDSKMSGIGRPGKPEEVGPLVAFLASDEGDYISGQTFQMGGLMPPP